LWEESAQRGVLMSRLACKLRVVAPDRAYTCGLFEHYGMTLLVVVVNEALARSLAGSSPAWVEEAPRAARRVLNLSSPELEDPVRGLAEPLAA